MSKFLETSFTNRKDILKFPDHYVALAITVDDAGVVVNADGKKIVPAGTILGGGVIADPALYAKPATTTNDVNGVPVSTDAEGVLLNDVDVTYGPALGALVIHGFINESKMPTAPIDLERDALKQIHFIV